MIRNIMLFLAGVIVTAGALVLSPRVRALFFDNGESGAHKNVLPVPPSSNIRVVGGSETISLLGYTWATDTATQLVVNKANVWMYQLQNVSAQANGNPVSVTYSHTSDSWIIDDKVRDSLGGDRGVRITASGTTSANGTARFTLLNAGDKFAPSPNPSAPSTDRWYHDQNCPDDDHRPCPVNKVDKILVKIQGVTTTWYCVDANRYCHIVIGN